VLRTECRMVFILLLVLVGALGIRWERDRERVFSYNSTLSVGADSSLDGVPQSQDGRTLRVVAHILTHRASEGEEQRAVAEWAGTNSDAALITIWVTRLRFLQPQDSHFRTFHRPNSSRRFQFLQVTITKRFIAAQASSYTGV
jgi:hypothetical protein